MKPTWPSSCVRAVVSSCFGLGVLGHVTLAQSRPEPPDLLLYEGSMVAGDGAVVGASNPVNYSAIFRVFDRLVGGQLLWSEQQTVSVYQGTFGVTLGEGNAYASEPRPALSSVFRTATASDRYVEMTLRGAGPGMTDVTLAPRTRLATGAYSILATHARTAQELVNRSGQPVLMPVGDKVGINRSSPSATLDVAGSFQSAGVVSGTATGAGTVEAGVFDGIGMAPVGSIVMWTGSTPPRGWVLCDGTVVSGVPTPDLRGRFVLGAGSGTGLTARAQGQVGGAEGHVLMDFEIPEHRHSVNFAGETSEGRNLGGGTHEYRVALGSTEILFNGWYTRREDQPSPAFWTMRANTSKAGSHAHRVDFGYFQSGGPSGGQGRPHSNMPPFYVLAFIMRVQ